MQDIVDNLRWSVATCSDDHTLP